MSEDHQAQVLRFTGFNEYQQRTADTAIYPEAGSGSCMAAAYVALGLASEAGEVAGRLKKVIRDKGGKLDDEDRKALRSELGDVMWYVSQLATEIGVSMSDIAAQNLSKLRDRKERGKLQGSGDTR